MRNPKPRKIKRRRFEGFWISPYLSHLRLGFGDDSI
jgi:hypothetical protein